MADKQLHKLLLQGWVIENACLLAFLCDLYAQSKQRHRHSSNCQADGKKHADD